MSTLQDRQSAAQNAARLYWVTMVEAGVEKTARVPFVPSQGCAWVRVTQAFRCDQILVFERWHGGKPVLVRQCWGDDLRRWAGDLVAICLSRDGGTLE
jgi:hypothetical protein